MTMMTLTTPMLRLMRTHLWLGIVSSRCRQNFPLQEAPLSQMTMVMMIRILMTTMVMMRVLMMTMVMMRVLMMTMVMTRVRMLMILVTMMMGVVVWVKIISMLDIVILTMKTLQRISKMVEAKISFGKSLMTKRVWARRMRRREKRRNHSRTPSFKLLR